MEFAVSASKRILNTRTSNQRLSLYKFNLFILMCPAVVQIDRYIAVHRAHGGGSLIKNKLWGPARCTSCNNLQSTDPRSHCISILSLLPQVTKHANVSAPNLTQDDAFVGGITDHNSVCELGLCHI